MCDKTVLLLKLIILFSLLDVNWSVRNSSFFLVFGERCLHSTKVLCVPQGYSARVQLPGLMVGAEEASHALLLLPYAQRVRAQLGEVCNRVSGLVYSVPHCSCALSDDGASLRTELWEALDYIFQRQQQDKNEEWRRNVAQSIQPFPNFSPPEKWTAPLPCRA